MSGSGLFGVQAPDGTRSRAPYSVAVIGGDGIGPEVVGEALKVVAASGVELQTTAYDLGAARYLRTGDVLPESVLEELAGHDAILLGAIGPPIGSQEIPPGLLERGLLLGLRSALDLYVNLRPFDAAPGSIAAGSSFVVVRENTEGSYAGEGGVLRRGSPGEVATQGSVNTRFGVERCVRYAFELARARSSQTVTLVHKTNVLSFAGDLWERTFSAVGESYPEIARRYCHVDAACIYLVEDPKRFDVIVTDNLFGDILTDLAGAVTGGIGFAASANLCPGGRGPALFEPVHGAAHDLVGRGEANPLAAIRSAGLLLKELGEMDAARLIDEEVLSVRDELVGHPEGVPWTSATPKSSGQSAGGRPSTTAIGDEVARRVRLAASGASSR